MIKKIFIIAGEASGDVMGSKLITELQNITDVQFEISGIGGQNMENASRNISKNNNKNIGENFNFTSIFPMEDLSVMGVLEVIPHLPKLIQRINFTVTKIIEFAPDYLITIDSPDFCFRVLKKLQKNTIFTKIKKVHFVAPSVWAYRQERAKKIAKLYDLLLAILPFEPPYFEKYGLKTVFIGHPLIDNKPDLNLKKEINFEFRKTYQINEDDKLILLTPGSRIGEVNRIFPEFIGAVNTLKNDIDNIVILIPVVKKTKNIVAKLAKKLTVKYFLIEQEEKNNALFACDFAIAKSGTNAIEISLYNIPLIIAYKINFLTHFIIKRMVKIKYANLLNLLANRKIIPELLQDNCQAQIIYQKILHLIKNDDDAKLQICEANKSLKMLGLNSIANPMAIATREIFAIKNDNLNN